MRTNFILSLVVFLTQALSASAQLPMKFAADDVLSMQNKSKNVIQAAKFKQNSGEIFDVLTASKITPFASRFWGNGASVNCSDSSSIFAPLAPNAAPCNGVSVTSVNFIKANRTKESTTIADNTVNVVYRYANAATAPDGTVLDALVTITNYSNNEDATPTTFRDADLFLNPDTNANVGFDNNLQPSLEPETNTLPNNVVWSGSITYRIQFVRAGTTTPKTISVAATTLDNDGSTICGGLKESVTYSSALNQTLTSNTTNQVRNGNTFTPNSTTVQPGIGTGIDYASAALFVNVTELSWTYSFATTSACTAGAASEDRFGSLNMSCQINFNKTFASVGLSGSVYNDTNGLTDSIVNGAGTNAGGLFANLLDANGNVVSSVAVAADGTYSFPTVVAGNYNIQISTNAGIESSPAPALVLPAGWVSTGEFVGTAAGNDGAVNGLLPVTIAASPITNANFGIEQRPVAVTGTAPTQTNPGGTTSVTVPAATFTATDTAPGTVANIRITAFPSNAASITIDGVQYTSAANFPAGGVTVPTTNGIPTQAILVDPIDGATTVVIPFIAIDNAGVVSSAAANANVPFATVSISGTVFNDVNGLTDGIVNGTGTNAGGLFANLLDANGVVVQTISVPASGVYNFANLNSGSYTVQISTKAGTVGSAAPVLSLPSGWVSTGEFVGTAAGNDGTVNGLLPVVLGAVSLANADFGIEQRPVANNNTAANQVNPGGTTNIAVPPSTFTATDTAPGTVANIRITAFPSNATSLTVGTTTYYPNAAAIPATCPTATCAAFPAAGVTIPTNTAGNPTQPILIDPISGAATAVIPYVAIDNAGVESASPANANVPFILAPTAGSARISGTVYFGATPLPNTLVVLLETGSNSKFVTRSNANGEYSFSDREVGKTYVVQPLSSKYSFGSTNGVVNLQDDVVGLNFNSTAKQYHPKNDFDGDGKTDVAVFRPTDGNWYVVKSGDEQVGVFNFGMDGDVPVAADYDGDGRTDYAVFRPSEGNWYIWQSKTQNLRVENFGIASDKLVPADFDGDGKADVAVYRDGNWYILRSSDGTLEAKNFGLANDLPATRDFDGDGRADFSVYRRSEGAWYSVSSSHGKFSAVSFGSAADVPAADDFDGDGFDDIAQYRSGNWFVLGSTTGFESIRLGSAKDKSIVGDFDGDGRSDAAVYRSGIWSIRNSADGTIRRVDFGLETDIPVK